MSCTKIVSVLILLAFMTFFLTEPFLRRQSTDFREYTIALGAFNSVLLWAGIFWCSTLVFLTFIWNDLPLVGLLLIAFAWYSIGQAESLQIDTLIIFTGVSLGKGIYFALKQNRGWDVEDKKNSSEYLIYYPKLVTFSLGLVILLAFAAWWHLDMPDNYYHGPRWMGLWDNPNTYGMLMAAGCTLTIGMLVANEKLKNKNVKTRWFFAIAIVMLGVGLVMSYSRGAWLATGISLFYLAWCYGKLKRRYVGLGIGLVALGAGLFWGGTADSAPWYVKRADLGRPSAQNRAIAWRAGLEIMRDHPLGVGWNKAVSLYAEKYYPPDGGPAALTTNDYLMIGTELGVPALVCFVAYVGLCFRGQRRMQNEECRIQTACRAAVLVFVVAFWFDGGLFKLPTAAMFWVLLELGAHRSEKTVDSGELMVDRPKIA